MIKYKKEDSFSDRQAIFVVIVVSILTILFLYLTKEDWYGNEQKTTGYDSSFTTQY